MIANDFFFNIRSLSKAFFVLKNGNIYIIIISKLQIGSLEKNKVKYLSNMIFYFLHVG